MSEINETIEQESWTTPEVETFAARDVYAVLTTGGCGGTGSAAVQGGGGDPGDCTSA